MFYNFIQYLKTQFPTETIYPNGRFLISGQTEIPDRNILVIESDGIEQPWTLYSQPELQIIVRDKSIIDARKLSQSIFEKITSRFGLILPSATVDGTVYPAVQVAQITAQQLPYSKGEDDEGRSEFVNNYLIIYRRG